MDRPLLDESMEEESTPKGGGGFTVPSASPVSMMAKHPLIETGLMATLLRIRLPKLDKVVASKNVRIVIVAALGVLSSILQNEVRDKLPALLPAPVCGPRAPLTAVVVRTGRSLLLQLLWHTNRCSYEQRPECTPDDLPEASGNCSRVITLRPTSGASSSPLLAGRSLWVRWVRRARTLARLTSHTGWLCSVIRYEVAHLRPDHDPSHPHPRLLPLPAQGRAPPATRTGNQNKPTLLTRARTAAPANTRGPERWLSHPSATWLPARLPQDLQLWHIRKLSVALVIELTVCALHPLPFLNSLDETFTASNPCEFPHNQTLPQPAL